MQNKKQNFLFLHNFSADFCSGPSPVPLSDEYCLVSGRRGIIQPEATLLLMFLQVVPSMIKSGRSLQKDAMMTQVFFVFPPTQLT